LTIVKRVTPGETLKAIGKPISLNPLKLKTERRDYGRHNNSRIGALVGAGNGF